MISRRKPEVLLQILCNLKFSFGNTSYLPQQLVAVDSSEMMVRRSESEKKDIKEKVKALDSQVWNPERREGGRR